MPRAARSATATTPAARRLTTISARGLLAADPATLPRRILLVRHGPSTYNEDHRVAGWVDAPLAPAGWALGERLREVLADVPIDAIHTSTLQRTVDTAAATATGRGLAIIRHEDLREQGLGVLEGRHRDERDPEAKALWERRAADRFRVTPPGGEDFVTLRSRVEGCLRTILTAEAGRTILIVGHRVANRAMLGALLGLADPSAAALRIRSRVVYDLTPPDGPHASISLRPESLGKRSPWMPVREPPANL